MVAYYGDHNNNSADAQHHNHAQETSTNDRSDGKYRGGRSGGREVGVAVDAEMVMDGETSVDLGQ